MDAFVFVCLTAVSLGSAAVYSQNLTAAPTEPAAVTNIINSAAKACVTARGQAGSCVGRERCDYGTAHIDFTLYVPRGYTNHCAFDQVCCPPEFYSSPEAESSVKVEPDNEYDFDDDD